MVCRKDPEKRREYLRNWRKANREKHREYLRNWRKANREKSRGYDRKWRKANPVEAANKNDTYRMENPEKFKVYKQISHERFKQRQAEWLADARKAIEDATARQQPVHIPRTRGRRKSDAG